MDFLHRTWAEIDISALIHNFNIIKEKCSNSKIMAVVKADAYGHSVKDIAPVLDREGASGFAVSNIDEALQLRECGIEKPILILGYTPVQLAKTLYKHKITQTVYCSDYAKGLSENAIKDNVVVDVHIKLDTGMGRLGFDIRQDNMAGLCEVLNVFNLGGLKVAGTFTHFPVADSVLADDKNFTEMQLNRFIAATQKIKAAGFNPGLIHCSNSAGVTLDSNFHIDLCRPGIILYGLLPSEDVKMPSALKPVMTLKSVVSMVKHINPGEQISYGRTFTAKKEMKIATITAGYADGYPRSLSNIGEVLISGKRAPILGRICMDQFMADITDIENVREGDEVVLFGDGLSIEELAEKCGTINYEIICGISPRVPRVIIKK